MFDDLKHAWKEAVENFWRELNEDEASGLPGDEPRKQLATMRRELNDADMELKRLETEVVRAQRAATSERSEEETCRRRLAMAEQIGDDETARLATTYAERAAERAAVLERKASALEAELELRRRDLTEMHQAFEAASAALGPGAADAAAMGAGGHRSSRLDPDAVGGLGTDWGLADEEGLEREMQHRKMRDEARQKAAEARLEELKKKMQP